MWNSSRLFPIFVLAFAATVAASAGSFDVVIDNASAAARQRKQRLGPRPPPRRSLRSMFVDDRRSDPTDPTDSTTTNNDFDNGDFDGEFVFERPPVFDNDLEMCHYYSTKLVENNSDLASTTSTYLTEYVQVLSQAIIMSSSSSSSSEDDCCETTSTTENEMIVVCDLSSIITTDTDTDADTDSDTDSDTTTTIDTSILLSAQQEMVHTCFETVDDTTTHGFAIPIVLPFDMVCELSSDDDTTTTSTSVITMIRLNLPTRHGCATSKPLSFTGTTSTTSSSTTTISDTCASFLDGTLSETAVTAATTDVDVDSSSSTTTMTYQNVLMTNINNMLDIMTQTYGPSIEQIFVVEDDTTAAAKFTVGDGGNVQCVAVVKDNYDTVPDSATTTTTVTSTGGGDADDADDTNGDDSDGDNNTNNNIDADLDYPDVTTTSTTTTVDHNNNNNNRKNSEDDSTTATTTIDVDESLLAEDNDTIHMNNMSSSSASSSSSSYFLFLRHIATVFISLWIYQ